MASAEVCARNEDDCKDVVIRNLYDLFGDALDNDIILTVASSCKFNLEATTNMLLEMLNNGGNSDRKTTAQVTNPPIENGFSYANAASSQKHRDNVDVIIESEKIINSKPSTSNLHMDATKNISVKSLQRSKKEQEFERVIQHIRQESKILIFMRGLPGSGKSYLARTIIDRSVGILDYHLFILSTDDYFYDRRSGTYIYDFTKLQEAHEWNQQRAYMKMSSGLSPVIIDNTNTQMWEMKAYAMMAANFGYIVEIVEPFTSWAFDIKQLFLKNSHNVPKAKIQDMLLRYEKDITPTNLFAAYNLSYTNFIPPMKRTYPPLRSTSITSPRSDSVEGKRSPQKLVQEIDLMGFEEEAKANDVIFVSDESNDAISVKSSQSSKSNLLDSFLIDSQSSSEILKPNVNENACSLSPETKNAQTFSDVSVTSFNDRSPSSKTAIKKPKDVYPTLDLSAWGLSENALSSWESWDVVTPLSKIRSPSETPDTDAVETFNKLETSDAFTNTSSYDFGLLDTNCLTLHSDSLKIIRATGRNINADRFRALPANPPKKILFDKSSMTDEDMLDLAAVKANESANEDINQLMSLFPTIPIDYLQDVYEKCGKDINWTVDLLLDDSKEILTNINVNQHAGRKNLSPEPECQESVIDNSELHYNQNHDVGSPNNSEEINNLKKHIEQRIEINRDLYSEHVMKIKNLKRSSDNICKNQPSSSKVSNFEVFATASGEVIALNSDVDVNDFEPDIDFPQTEETEEQQTVEINLGDTCVNQLESLFGLPETFPKGFLPVVHIPLELAEQLHAFYIQSVLHQIDAQNSVLDMITKEDEELARELQKQDEVIDQTDDARSIDLQTIMKEQVADRLHKKKVDEWMKLTPDTLAAKLTMQKLVDSFPSVDQTVLTEILFAHNNSYVQTVEVLLASTDACKIHDPDGKIREPPIADSVVSDMNRARAEKLEDENAPDISKSANEYRDEANTYHKKHNDYMQKAQRAFQNRQYPVAQFYSDMAKSYTQLYEQTNSLAATAFLQEHSSRLQNFHTLDLHYLYVKEAIPALDMFLDANINLLSDSRKKTENLFIITGRGKRNSVGKSRLKPAAIQRLKKRELQWVELNPGLLKVKIHPHSLISNNV